MPDIMICAARSANVVVTLRDVNAKQNAATLGIKFRPCHRHVHVPGERNLAAFADAGYNPTIIRLPYLKK